MKLRWKKAGNYSDILYHKADGIARVTINRPEKRNAFRPETVTQMIAAFTDAREDASVGVVLLTGAGPHKDGKYAFCSGGDQSVRGGAGYVGGDGVPRLNVLDLQKLIRSMPKVVIALVAGYAIGGGHVLHLICDLTIAADNSLAVKEMEIPREMLYLVDEAFFCGTAAEVTPVLSVDRFTLGNGTAGPVTTKIRDQFFAIVSGRAPDTHGWLTAVPVAAGAASR